MRTNFAGWGLVLVVIIGTVVVARSWNAEPRAAHLVQPTDIAKHLPKTHVNLTPEIDGMRPQRFPIGTACLIVGTSPPNKIVIEVKGLRYVTQREFVMADDGR